MKTWKIPGIVILLVTLVACSCSNNQSVTSEDSPQTAESDIRASLSNVAEQYLEVTPADSFSYSMTMEEAYKWQDEFMKLLEPQLGPVIGYKAGGFDKSRQSSDTSRYWRGTFLEKMFFNSGAHISMDSFINSFIESDLLLRVGSEEINTATTDDEILSALDAVIPFIEFPDSIFKSTGMGRGQRQGAEGDAAGAEMGRGQRQGAGGDVAGAETSGGQRQGAEGGPAVSGMSTGIITNMGTRIGVMGNPIPLTASEDCKNRLNTFTIVMTDQDGKELGSASVEAKYEPLEVVRWLRDSLREGGKVLKKGHILSLGNLGVNVPIDKGDAADAEMGRGQRQGAPGDAAVTGRGAAFTGTSVTLKYLGLDPTGPAEVVVNFDR